MNPDNNNVISVENLTTTPKVFTPATPSNPFDYASAIRESQATLASGLQNAQSEVDLARNNAKNESLAIATLQGLQGGQEADRANQYQAGGVNALYNQLSDLNAQATGLSNEAQAIPIQTQQDYKGRLSTQAGTAAIDAGKLRENALKALSLGQQYAIASGNYEKAKNIADQTITAKYAQLEADIKAKQTNLATLKDFDLTPAENKLLKLQETALKREEQDLADKKANEKAISDMLVQASSQNAPSALVVKAQAAKTPSEAAMILGQYAGDYYKTELLKNQIATEKAQRAKIYADVSKSQAELKAINDTNISSEAASWVANINSGKAKLSDVPASLKTQVSVGLASSTGLSAEQKSKIEASQSTYDLANELLTLSGKGGAVGAGIGKALGAVIPGYDGTAFSGTDRANYEAKVAQLKDTLASANLDKLKGAMSDKDIEFLRNIGTALKPTMSEAAFDSELNKIKTTMTKIPGVIPAETPEQKTYNPFTQALGQPSQVIPGTKYIEGYTSSGEINFTLPTPTKQ